MPRLKFPWMRIDALWDELKALDPQNKLFTVPLESTDGFAKSEHIIPAGSQEGRRSASLELLFKKNINAQ